MTYQYNIATSKKDSRSNVCLLVCHALTDIITLFLSTFLIAHIYSVTQGVSNYIFNVGVYETSMYVAVAVAYFIMSPIVQKTNRIWIYRLALALRAILVIFVVFFGENLADMIVFAGALNGISYGCYLASYNVIRQEMVSRNSMNSFLAFSSIVSKTLSIVAPIVIGSLIDISTFSQVAIYVAVICIIQIIVSFGISSKRPENSTYNLKQYLNKLKTNPAKNKIKHVYLTYIAYGTTTIVGTLLTVCVMMEFGSNFSLGAITSIISAVSVLVLILFSKFTKPGKRAWLFIVLAILPLSSLLVVFLPSTYAVVIYQVCMGIAMIILNPTLATYRNGNLKEAGLYDCIDEHQSVVELIMAVCRIVGFVLLMLIGASGNLVLFKVLLGLSSLSYSAVLISLLIYEKKYLANNKTV